MVLLTIFREVSEGKTRRCSRTYKSVGEAVQHGQRSGCYYDIYDTATGRHIDWNEINVKEDDGWYYDETDYTWKKVPADISIEEWMRTELSWLFEVENNASLPPLAVLYNT